MKLGFGEYLRSIVSSMVGIDLESPAKEDKDLDAASTKETKVKYKRKDNEIVEKPYKTSPKIKPKRRDTSLSEWDYKDKRKEYMKDYRSEGKDSETGNKYVKKVKGA